MHRAVIFFIPVLLMLATGELRAAADIWQDVPAAQSLPGAASRSISTIRHVRADDVALRSALANVPHENSGDRSRQIQLPMPDGTQAMFSVVESPIIEQGIVAQHPEIKTFRVFGIDDEHASGRIAITQLGFNGLIDTTQGSVYISSRDHRVYDNVYLTRYKNSSPGPGYTCGVHDTHQDLVAELAPRLRTANRRAGNLIQYRLAVAATLEYHQFFGNDPILTRDAIIITINNVNVIYERDLGIRLNLVIPSPEIYETTDQGLENDNALALIGQVNGWINGNLIGGVGAYDIGHIFSRPPALFAGGVANLGAVCTDGVKAGGVSGMPTPLGTSFDIDLVAHEIGHQFNADHTFNGSSGNCAGQRNGLTAYEPGSGSTIMAYASSPAICGTENLQLSSENTFHAGSMADIDAFTNGAGSCYAAAPNGNGDPVIVGIADQTIPANTPFRLEGAATDPDTDPITYSWDQMDTGCPTDATTLGTDIGSNPLFRSNVPRGQGWRNFPTLGTQREGRFDSAEVLPCQNRDLNFRLTARDGNSGQDFEDVRLTVENTAGPFVVTNLDPDPGTIFEGTPFQVTWDPAGTDLSPTINCTNVDIDLLTFNAAYTRYTIYNLVTSVPNTPGSAMVTISDPAGNTHPRARVRVKCNDNVFYDISDADLNVQTVNTPVTLPDTDRVAYTYSPDIPGLVSPTAPTCGPVVDCSTPVVPPSGGGNGDASAFGYSWMLLLAGLSLFRHRRLLIRDGSAS